MTQNLHPDTGAHPSPPHSPCCAEVEENALFPAKSPAFPLLLESDATRQAGGAAGWEEELPRRGVALGDTCPISITFASTDGGKLPDLSAAGSQIQRFATGHQA